VNDALGVPGFDDDAKDEVGVGDLLLVIELFLDSFILLFFEIRLIQFISIY